MEQFELQKLISHVWCTNEPFSFNMNVLLWVVEIN